MRDTAYFTIMARDTHLSTCGIAKRQGELIENCGDVNSASWRTPSLRQPYISVASRRSRVQNEQKTCATYCKDFETLNCLLILLFTADSQVHTMSHASTHSHTHAIKVKRDHETTLVSSLHASYACDIAALWRAASLQAV